VFEYLLERGAKPDTVGRGGVTARSLAKDGNYTAILRLLDAKKKP
jgi:hypothetical protein